MNSFNKCWSLTCGYDCFVAAPTQAWFPRVGPKQSDAGTIMDVMTIHFTKARPNTTHEAVVGNDFST